MDNRDENIKKIKRFIEYDLRIKNILNNIIPVELDFYDVESRFRYTGKLLDGIDRINMYMCKMMIDYNLPVDVIEKFDKQMHMIDKKINSKEFSDILNKGYKETLNFINKYISFMRVDFVDSIRKGFKGYYLNYGEGVLEPETINEYLHYVHSYVINKEDFYRLLPVVKTTSVEEWNGISLRGISNEFGNNLYEKIINFGLDSDLIDIVNLDKNIIIMARGLGHATVIEVDLSNMDSIFVRYFIPKNNNIEMTCLLRGIYTNNSIYACGQFLTNRDNFVSDICNFMKGIPTDYDSEFVKNGGFKV